METPMPLTITPNPHEDPNDEKILINFELEKNDIKFGLTIKIINNEQIKFICSNHNDNIFGKYEISLYMKDFINIH